MFRIVRAPIEPLELVVAVSRPGHGGIATFVGAVRDQNEGKKVVAIEYQAYEPMAIKTMQSIGEEMRRAYGEVEVAMVHRVGRLQVGEVSVVVAVGAPHRHEALGALGFGIERLKQAIPVWKKEFYADGSSWLEQEPPGRSPEATKS